MFGLPPDGAGVKGWLARELPVQVRPAGAASRPERAEATTPARTGRVPLEGLGNTMMRRMIGRYKGCRCAGWWRASRPTRPTNFMPGWGNLKLIVSCRREGSTVAVGPTWHPPRGPGPAAPTPTPPAVSSLTFN